jgi:hypothetical protein
MSAQEQASGCRVVKGFVTPEERELLLEKADRHFYEGLFRANPTGPHRFLTRLDEPPKLDELVETMTQRIIDTFGLHDCPQEPVLNKLISRIDPGGFIQIHTDTLPAMQRYLNSQGNDFQMPDGAENFRCNIMVQMADESGYPVIDGQAVALSECDAWGFLASRWSHGTQVVAGKTRIIYGFGFIVPADFQLGGVPSPP